MSVSSRTFRRNTAQFWEIWPMPPKVEEHKDIVFVDGIYLGRKACVLICCDEIHVLGWYVDTSIQGYGRLYCNGLLHQI